jgi:hypothetical protein
MTLTSIVADSDEIANLSRQLRLAANYAGDAAAAVLRGQNLGDLAAAAALDPVGAIGLQMATAAVLIGPFGLVGVQASVERFGTVVLRAAADYVGTEDHIAYELLAGDPLGAALTVLRPYADLAPLLPPLDGAPVVTRLGAPAVALPAPVGADGLLANLRRTSIGTIDVQLVSGTDALGRPVRKVIVYLPGTDDWSPKPGRDVNDLTTDVLAIGGAPTAYERGVLVALRDAGVTSADDITLVGHSQGGLIAVNAAKTATETGEFNVTHVVTVGSPTGLVARDLPASTSLLAIENRADLVPRTDSMANPHRAGISTVEVEHDTGSITDNHELEGGYLTAGADVDASTDPSVRAFLADPGGPVHIEGVRTIQYRIEGTLIEPLPVR